VLTTTHHRKTGLFTNKVELHEDWKDSIIIPIYKGNKTDCSNYRSISILSSKYKTLRRILPSRLTPYAEKIIRDHQCGQLLNIYSAFAKHLRKKGIQ
jgi:hypothetical protein